MSLLEFVIAELRTQVPVLPDPDLQELAEQITSRIESRSELVSLPEALVQRVLRPTFQIMLAQEHSSIENAAQYAIQVLITQVVEDPHSTIPEQYRNEQSCPYPGLQAYTEADADYFHGRDQDIQAFLENQEQPLIAITGPSGVGKSSFVMAGVFPHLRARFGETAAYLVFRVNSNPNLLREFATYLSEATGRAADALLQSFTQSDEALWDSIQTFTVSNYQRVFLVLDQFETLFVGDDPTRSQERQRFLANLLYTEMHQQRPFLTIIITSRENFFEHPDYTNQPQLVEIVQRGNVRLATLEDRQLREAIEQPLAVFNIKHRLDLAFQTGLVDLIISEFRKSTISLPIVQYLLRLLWIEKHHLTHFAYNSLGGLDRVLDRHATEIYDGFAEEDQALIKMILTNLVRPGLAGEYTRKRVKKDSFFTVKSDSRERLKLQRIIERLSDARSRIISEQQIGDIVYLELTHEIILRQWTLLHTLIEVRQERIEERERLLPTAELWQQSIMSNRPRGDFSYLYRGDSLKRAQRYVEDPRFENDVDATIVACYIVSRSHQRRNFIWNIVITAIVLFLFITILVILWNEITVNRQQTEANATAQADAEQRQATSQARTIEEQHIRLSTQLVLAAQSQIDIAPETALLLSYEAVQYNRSSASEQVLRDALDHQTSNSIILKGHDRELQSALFSPDGQYIITTSDDETGRLWNLRGQLITILEGHTNWDVRAAFSPNSQYIVTASADKTARLWNLKGQLLATLTGHTDVVTSAAFSPDGQYILTASEDKTARLWNLKGQLLATLTGHTDVVTSAAFSPDGQYILTASADKTARLWNLEGQSLVTLTGHTDWVKNASFNSDGNRILTASSDKSARIWDLQGQLLAVLSGHTDQVSSAVFSPDGQLILTSSKDRTARLWDASGNTIITLKGHTDWITSAAFSPDGQHIITASDDHTARLWDLPERSLVTLKGHTASVYSGNWSPDGRYIVTASGDKTARLWNDRGQMIVVLKGHTDWVKRAVFSPDGQSILTASGDKTARLWNLQGQMLTTFSGHEDIVNSAIFSPDGQSILTASDDGTARLWNLRGQLLTTFSGHQTVVNSAVFSPDGQSILTASDDGTARLWNLRGQLLTIFRGHNHWLVSAAFSPDGRYILTSSTDNTAELWNPQGELLTTLMGHTGNINSSVFSPDGSHILTASSDETVRLWSLKGELLTTFNGHTDSVFAAVFSPRGERILSISADKTARQYAVSVDDLLAIAACRVARGLTENDIKEFQVPIPLQFNFEKRRCPPVLSWE